MDINFSVIFWTVVNFFVFMLALYFVLFRPLLGFMHKRSERIEQGRNAGRNAQIRLDDVSEECEEMKEAARNEAAAALEEARGRARSDAEDRLTAKMDEVRREHAEKLARLAEEEKKEEARLEERLGVIAVMIADKVTESRI